MLLLLVMALNYDLVLSGIKEIIRKFVRELRIITGCAKRMFQNIESVFAVGNVKHFVYFFNDYNNSLPAVEPKTNFTKNRCAAGKQQ